MTTGKPNALDAAINKFIDDRKKNQPLTVSTKEAHLAQVKWNADSVREGGGKTVFFKGVQADNFKTP